MRKGLPYTDLFIFSGKEGMVTVQGATGRGVRLLNDAGHDLVDQTIAVLTEEPFVALMARVDELGLTTTTFG